jgi:transcriptional regulator with XRE-family HTH domain
MREKERKMARKKLDVEMRPYRRAGKDKHPTNDLLRAVRQTLHVPVAEIAEKMGVCKSVVLDLEAREPKNTVTLRSMSRMAQAMGCKMVYGIVPMGGKTLEALAEHRLWASVLGVGREQAELVASIRSWGKSVFLDPGAIFGIYL